MEAAARPEHRAAASVDQNSALHDFARQAAGRAGPDFRNFSGMNSSTGCRINILPFSQPAEGEPSRMLMRAVRFETA
jgi:hypothetical protein